MFPAFTSLATLLLLSYFLLSTSATQQEVLDHHPHDPFTANFAQLVNETLELWHVPGIAIGVVDGNDTWAEGYGISRFPDTPVTPNTLFCGASTTKAFTAAAMSLLISSGNHSELAWDAPISSLIREEFVLEDPYFTNHVTIEDACSHRSGLPPHDFSYGGEVPNGDLRVRADSIRSLKYLPLTAGIRSRFQYCNIMYVVISYVIEKFTGVWLGEFLKENIWVPLGMKSTYFSTAAAQAAPEPLAQGYVYLEEKFQVVPYMDLSSVSGAGSVISNVLDYSKWLRALLSRSGPLSEADYSSLFTSRTLFSPSGKSSPYTGPQAYALGWFTGTYQGYEFFEHGGGMEAFGAEVVLFPSLNYGIVSFGNTGGTSNYAGQALIWHLIDEKLAIPLEKRFDRNKKNFAQLANDDSNYKNAMQIHYPNIPSPPLPHRLPLKSYTGVYTHPAYNSITLTLDPKSGRLHADRSNVTWQTEIDLEHVSGEYFLAWIDSKTAPRSVFKGAQPAEFVVRKDGVVGTLGIALEPAMKDPGRIWFERVV